MRGKTVVITGGTSGIGEVAALALAKMGARIVLVARDKSRGDATLARLRDSAPGIAHSVHFSDLLRLAEMKRVAAQIADQESRIDILINNAGALFGKRRLTEDGLEYTFALNHMAYFVMTAGLRERLLASDPARIINTASAAHQGATLDFDDLQSAKSFRATKAYGRSKLCNILFTRELARRLHGTGITANCLHSGFVATRFGDKSGGLISRLVWLAKFSQYLLLRAQKRLSISRPRQTWPRRQDNIFTSLCRLRRRRGPRTTDLLYCSGSAARHWPA
jgi:NAD(P)-dependent dehydrogenase (short-subunit alcohol dehydrogenase family)